MKMRRGKTRTAHTPCQKKQDRCWSLSRNTYLTDACISSINEQSRRKGVKSVEVGGENDARGHVPPAKDIQKKSQCIPDARWARKENKRVGWEGSA
jgi:hypothetical protein